MLYASHFKDTQKALEDYNKAIEVDRLNAEAYLNRALLFHERKEFKKAVEDYTRVLQCDPKNSIAYFNRGMILLDYYKEKERAEKDLLRAHRYDSESVEIAQALKNVQEQLGRSPDELQHTSSPPKVRRKRKSNVVSEKISENITAEPSSPFPDLVTPLSSLSLQSSTEQVNSKLPFGTVQKKEEQ